MACEGGRERDAQHISTSATLHSLIQVANTRLRRANCPLSETSLPCILLTDFITQWNRRNQSLRGQECYTTLITFTLLEECCATLITTLLCKVSLASGKTGNKETKRYCYRARPCSLASLA